MINLSFFIKGFMYGRLRVIVYFKVIIRFLEVIFLKFVRKKKIDFVKVILKMFKC